MFLNLHSTPISLFPRRHLEDLSLGSFLLIEAGTDVTTYVGCYELSWLVRSINVPHKWLLLFEYLSNFQGCDGSYPTQRHFGATVLTDEASRNKSCGGKTTSAYNLIWPQLPWSVFRADAMVRGLLWPNGGHGSHSPGGLLEPQQMFQILSAPVVSVASRYVAFFSNYAWEWHGQPFFILESELESLLNCFVKTTCYAFSSFSCRFEYSAIHWVDDLVRCTCLQDLSAAEPQAHEVCSIR